MVDWSWKYGKPRSEVHFERYGNTDVPARRGMGGAKQMGTGSTGFWILVAVVIAGIVTYVLTPRT